MYDSALYKCDEGADNAPDGTGKPGRAVMMYVSVFLTLQRNLPFIPGICFLAHETFPLWALMNWSWIHSKWLVTYGTSTTNEREVWLKKKEIYVSPKKCAKRQVTRVTFLLEFLTGKMTTNCWIRECDACSLDVRINEYTISLQWAWSDSLSAMLTLKWIPVLFGPAWCCFFTSY